MDDDEFDALRSDGGVVHIRPVHGSDRAAMRALNARVSAQSVYRRFFTMSRQAADEYSDGLASGERPDRLALAALVGNDLVGVAVFEQFDPSTAEFAVLVDDRCQHEGIGTLLIEQLASAARQRGISRFIADVLAENTTMVGVIRSLGYDVESSLDYGTLRISFAIEATGRVVDAVDQREGSAEVASLRPILYPSSIAVIGAGARAGSAGRAVLRNILEGGFTGSVHVVNPKHGTVFGCDSVPSAEQLPVAPDLAIVAVAAEHVPDVLIGCGKRGARGVVVLSSGFGELGAAGQARQAEIRRITHSYGMRLIGPNCLGVVNTDPRIRLNATFAPVSMRPGHLALASQSGALGAAVLAAADSEGLAVAQFVSMGNKVDISSNDLLLEWERTPDVRVIALYLESFGNPRKFARIARRVAQYKPIIAIKAGRTISGQRAGQSHTAAAASSDVVVDALFEQAGVVRVDTMQQMLDASRLLVCQPAPKGARVAIVGNSGGPGILAADAAIAAGLDVVELGDVSDLLRASVPTAASVANPVDLGAGAQPDEIGTAVRILLDAPGVDAVLAVLTEVQIADAGQAIAKVAEAAAGSPKPVVITQVGSRTRSVPVPGSDGALPVYPFPEPAAAALGYAARYGRIRATPVPEPQHLPDVHRAEARELVSTLLSSGGGWLGPEDAAALLGHYGVGGWPQRVVHDIDAAVRAAAELGYPLVAKLADGTVHKSERGGVRLAITDQAALCEATVALLAESSSPRAAVLLQPVAPAGVELVVGAVADAQFGPLVMLGLGGVLADVLADRQLRLVPLGPDDVDEMINGLRARRLLDGYRGSAAVSRPALRDLVARIAALADDLPEIAELDLNPVICRGDQLAVVDAKVRIATAPRLPDPLARQL